MENPQIQFRNSLVAHFSLSELNELCFDLGIDFENIFGSTKSDKARELIAYFGRHKRLSELIDRVKEVRPAANWPDIEYFSAVTPDPLPSPAILAKQAAFLTSKQPDMDILDGRQFLQIHIDASYTILEKLYALKKAGDALWKKASKHNANHYQQCMEAVEKEIFKNVLFLEEQHYEELQELLKVFAVYLQGKKTYIRARPQNAILRLLSSVSFWQRLDQSRRRQVARNRANKQRYEQLLNEIRVTFRNRLEQIIQ